MASDNDTLKQAEKLAKLEESIRLSAERTLESYRQRASVIDAINKSLEEFSFRKQSADADEYTSSLKRLTDQMSDMIEQSSGLKGLVADFNSMSSATKPIATNLDDIESSLTQMTAKKTSDGLSEMFDELKSGSDSSSELSSEFNKLGKVTEGFVSKAGKVAAAIHGLRIGFQNANALIKGSITIFGSVSKSIFNVGAAFLSIPLSVFGDLVKHAGETAGGIDELRLKLEEVRKEFGAFWGPISGTVVETTRTFKGFNDTGLNSYQIFGTIAERLVEVHKTISGMGATVGLLTTEWGALAGGALMGYQKALGVSSEEMRGFGSLAVATGTSMSDIFKELGALAFDLGEQLGIDSKLIGRDMSKAVLDVKHFGGATKKEIAEASVYARKLGVELDKIVNTLDAFETFDSAATNASKLSQSFGVTVDAFKLMEAQSPAEQLDMLRKQFKAAGVDTSNFNRQQLKLLASTTGLSEDIVKQTFSLHNQGAALDEIKKKSGDTSRKQLTQAEVLSKLADNIERLVKPGEAMHGGFFDQFIKGFKDGVYWSQDFQQVLRNIRIGLASVYREGYKLGQFFVQMFPGVKGMLKDLQDLFKPGRFSSFAKEARNQLSLLFTGDKSVGDVIEKLQTSFTTIFSSDSYARLKDNFTLFAEKFAKIGADTLRWAAGQIAIGLKYVTDIMSGKKKLPGTGGLEDSAKTFGGRVFGPIIAGLKDAYSTLKDPVKNAFSELGKLLTKVVKSETFKNISATVASTLLGVIVGPVFTRLAATVGVSLLGEGLKKLFISGIPTIVRTISSSLGVASGPIGAAFAVALSGIFISNGVEKFAKNLPAELKGSERDFTAGVAGIIDGLTAGLLPEKWVLKASLYVNDGFNKLTSFIEKKVGGYGSYIKDAVTSGFKVLEGIGDVLKGIFDEDGEKVVGGITKMFSGVISALGNIATSLPTIVLNLFVKASKIVTTGIVGAFGSIATILAGAIFGPATARSVRSSFDSFMVNLKEAFDKISVYVTAAGGFFKDVTKNLLSGNFSEAFNVKSFSERIEEITKKGLEDGLKGGAAAVKPLEEISQGLDFKDAPEKYIERTGDILAKAEDLKRNFESFDVSAIQSSFDKLKSLNVSGLDGTVLPAIEKGVEIIKSVADAAKTISSSVMSFGTIQEGLNTISNGGILNVLTKINTVFSPDQISSATSNIEGLQKFANVISASIGKDLAASINVLTSVVEAANDLESALSDSKLNSIKVATKLKAVASATGLGSSGRYTIENKAVQINLNLQVVMEAGEVERVILLKKESLIRDRINFLSNKTNNTEGKLPASPDIATTLVDNGTKLYVI